MKLLGSRSSVSDSADPHHQVRQPAGEPTVEQLLAAIGTVIHGKEGVVSDFLTAVIAGGSILLEDLPGVGKTTLAKTFAQLVSLSFDRLQCTPDLLPADVFGFSVYNSQDGTFTFRPGPIFCNVLLVDEINRASPRTQSALLEAMGEGQVTIEGKSRQLQDPFLVIATQNPSGFQGTYPLPEAQLDRFLYHLTLDYPDHQSEIDLLYSQEDCRRPALTPILDAAALEQLKHRARQVEVHRDVADYMVRIVRATRESKELQIGCSPRGSQMLFRAAQAAALVAGRKHVLPDDVQHVAPLVLAHRVVGRSGAHHRHAGKRPIIDRLLSEVTVPA